MPLITQSIPNLINGVSEQNSVQRNPTQAESQINFTSEIVDGLTKRPPLQYMKLLASGTDQKLNNISKIDWINRDSTKQNVIVWKDNAAPQVWDLSGTAKSVSVAGGSSASYLNCDKPLTQLKTLTIADYTFVVNTTKTTAMAATTTTAKNQEFMIYFKSTNYGRLFTIKLKHPDLNSSYPYGIEARLQMPDAGSAGTESEYLDTHKLVDIFLYGKSSQYWGATMTSRTFQIVKLNATGGIDTTLVTDTGSGADDSKGLATLGVITGEFTFTGYGNVLYCDIVDGNSGYTVTTTDGFGNQGMYAIRDEIQDFTDLPKYTKDGTIIKVTGAKGDTTADYYVEYDESGIVWKETVAPNVKTTIDPETMPHALVRQADGSFVFQELTWTTRDCGDETSNPNPSFIGETINNLTFFKNRLGILAGQNLILSENGEYYNFFATTQTDTLDTDPIDIATSGSTVDELYNSIEFNEQLLLFTGTSQYILESSGETITPVNAVLTRTSSFSHNTEVSPIDTGRFVYFAQKQYDRTSITEYFSNDDSLVHDGQNITIGVSNLISQYAHEIIPAQQHNKLFVLTSGTPVANNTASYSTHYSSASDATAALTTTEASRLYCYEYFWDGNSKQQSAWSYWEIPRCEILGARVYEEQLYVVYNYDNQLRLGRFDLRNSNFNHTLSGYVQPSPSYQLHLDNYYVMNAATSYNSTTDVGTYTLPFRADDENIKAYTLYGVELTISSVAEASSSTTNVLISGRGANHAVIFGFPYTSTYQFSTPYPRKGEGGSAITTGRYQIRRLFLDYSNSGYFKVTVTPDNRDAYVYEMTGTIISSPTATTVDYTTDDADDGANIASGRFSIPIQSKNTDYTVAISSDSVLPCHFVSAEYEGYYKNRASIR